MLPTKAKRHCYEKISFYLFDTTKIQQFNTLTREKKLNEQHL